MADSVYASIENTPLNLINFNFSHILHYTDVIDNAHSIKTDQRQTMIKGQKFFADRFVTGIGHRAWLDKEGSNLGFAVRATVKAEMKMKKMTSYYVTALILDDNSVKSVSCQCPGGASPACCKHAFALLSAIEDYSRTELYSAPTEKLQKWHRPKATKVSPKKYTETIGAGGSKNLSSAMSTSSNTVNMAALAGLQQTMPIFSVMSSASVTDSLLADQVFYGSTVALPLPPSNSTAAQSFLPAVLDADIILSYHMHVRKSLEQLQELEKNTMSQTTPLWHKEREIRITASKIHEILHAGDKTKLCEHFLTKKDLGHLPPIKLGKRIEPMVKNIIRSDYESQDFIFRNTGLVVHPLLHFLGASPDGLLFKKEDTMIVEIKCVFNPSHMTLQKLCQKRKNFYLEDCSSTSDSFRLKVNHQYYTQIQTQLFCTGVEKCLFVVFFDFNKPVFKQIILQDHAFWSQDKLNVLYNFYFSQYLPKILAAKRL